MARPREPGPARYRILRAIRQVEGTVPVPPRVDAAPMRSDRRLGAD
jgi:hypothetical protein